VSLLEYRSYEFEGHTECALCLGLDHDRRLLIIPPLFDEMNRVRRLLVTAMRHLDSLGSGSMIADLPGTHESLASLDSQNLAGWRDAMTAAAMQLGVTHIASLRGGALIDDAMPDLPHWRLAPVKGASLLKTMIRTRIAGAKEEGVIFTEAALLEEARRQAINLAGNHLSPAMIADLQRAVPMELPHLTERQLGDDIMGSPLWLRAEPQDDPAMSDALARDWDRWSRACAA
jgi:hypothetical protein